MNDASRDVRRAPADMNRRRFIQGSLSVAALAFLESCRSFQKVGAAPRFPWPYPARPWRPVTFPVDSSMLLDAVAPVKGSTVRVLCRAGYLNPRVSNQLFPDQTGINVQVTPFDSMAQALELLTHNNIAADLIIGVPKDGLGAMIGAGLFRPLNHAFLPNLANLWPVFSSPEGSFWDVGMRYSVPYSVWTMGVAFTTGTKERQGLDPGLIDPANPYQVFWNQALSGNVNLLDDERQLVTLALLRNGVTGTAGINTDRASARGQMLADAKSALAELEQSVGPSFSNKPTTAIADGQAFVSQAYSSDLLAGKQYHGPAWDPNLLLYYSYPQRSGEIGGDHMAILAGGRNPDAAFMFMNWLLDNDNAMLNFAFTGAQPPLSLIQSADQLIKGSLSALSGRYGSYAITVPWLASAIVTQEIYSKGWFGGLELSPGVQAEWLNAVPAEMAQQANA